MATVMQTTTTTTEVPGSKRHFWDREPLLSLRRVLWVVLGGWMFFLVFFFVGVAFAITIVGMPMAYEFFKFARFLLLPVGYRAISRSGKYVRTVFFPLLLLLELQLFTFISCVAE
jgi:uncharacterized membrane protein YccF (DUF307 family)